MNHFYAAVAIAFSLIATQAFSQESKTVLVHYMPWYSSKPVSGTWGWHWTMKNCDPEKVAGDGREIASHYYPLIGPYDSNDPDALECHVLLMKFAGIQGVVIDWYGIEGHWDYADNHRNSQHLVTFIKRAGLKFVVCYEDQTVQPLIDAKIVDAANPAGHGKQVLNWLARNWFADDAYLKTNGKPILLVFGPQFYQGDQLKRITDSLETPPVLFALPHLSKTAKADGAFGWPPVDGGKRITAETWRAYLDAIYQRGEGGEAMIATVFPQFHDFYQQGENRPSFGLIEHRDGKTLEETIELAVQSNSQWVQIATWNDYGEGTMIEPTREFGYRFLETIQSKMAGLTQVDFSYTKDDLRLPVQLYELRKKLNHRKSNIDALDSASKHLYAGQCSQAKAILDRLSATPNE